MLESKIQKRVTLEDRKSPTYLSELEKVAIAALALQTTNPDAINDLIGMDQDKVSMLLYYLDNADWDIPIALGSVALNSEYNWVDNSYAYPILSMKGAMQ